MLEWILGCLAANAYWNNEEEKKILQYKNLQELQESNEKLQENNEKLEIILRTISPKYKAMKEMEEMAMLVLANIKKNRWQFYSNLTTKYNKEIIDYLINNGYLEADDQVPGYKRNLMIRKRK